MEFARAVDKTARNGINFRGGRGENSVSVIVFIIPDIHRILVAIWVGRLQTASRQLRWNLIYIAEPLSPHRLRSETTEKVLINPFNPARS